MWYFRPPSSEVTTVPTVAAPLGTTRRPGTGFQSPVRETFGGPKSHKAHAEGHYGRRERIALQIARARVSDFRLKPESKAVPLGLRLQQQDHGLFAENVRLNPVRFRRQGIGEET